jgi:hypothetical protein
MCCSTASLIRVLILSSMYLLFVSLLSTSFCFTDLRARAGVLALHTQCFKLFSLDLVLTDKQTQMLDRQAQTLNSEVTKH